MAIQVKGRAQRNHPETRLVADAMEKSGAAEWTTLRQDKRWEPGTHNTELSRPWNACMVQHPVSDEQVKALDVTNSGADRNEPRDLTAVNLDFFLPSTHASPVSPIHL